MSRIKTIGLEEASDRLLEIYREIIQKRGKLAEVHKIQSLRPESIVSHMDLYMEIMFSKSELSRADREMMAVIVSASNGCQYCRNHHTEALNYYWKNKEKTNSLVADFEQAELSPVQIALCRFSRQLTLHPADFEEDTEIEHLKESGFSDQAILDATLVVAYFNFVNRLVLALGVEDSEKEVGGYRY